MNKLISIAKFIVGWPLSLISLYFVFRLIISNTASFQSLGKVNILFLILGILFFLIYFFLRITLWNEIIKEKGNKLSFKKTAYYWEISEIKRYTPGNIWSFLSRSSLFTKDNLSTKNIISSLLSEMVLIVLACFSLSIFYIFFLADNRLLNVILTVFTFFTVILYIFIRKIDKIYGNKFNLKHNKIYEIKDMLLPGNNYSNNVKLFLISLSSFFIFGVATYFSAASIFYLNLKYLMELISLFVFSLLIGYVSIVTPMGLGVREGVMTLGLSYFIPLSFAGIVAIFSRVVFIVSEIISLFIILLWNRVKVNYIEKLELFFKKYKHELILLLFMAVYIIYFTSASFLRYDNFYTGRFDLGNMDQTVWNTTHGRIFQLTNPNGTDIISRLAFHADFVLILLSPLYLIWSNPKMLLLIQTTILALGAVFIYLISKEILKNKNLSLVISVVFLLNPSLEYANLYDFHPVTLGTTFLLASFYYFLKKEHRNFLMFAVLAGLTKEHVWLIIAIFGLAIIIRALKEGNLNIDKTLKRRLKEIVLGIFVFLISSYLFYFLIWKAIPSLSGGNHFALSYYSDFGDSASSVVKNIFLSPIRAFSIIFLPQKIYYLLELLLPLGFLPIIFPVVLIFSLPDLTINLLSNNGQLHQIYYQYTSTITPFLFIAAIYSINLLKNKFSGLNNNKIILYLIITSVVSAYFLGPLPSSRRPNVEMFSNQLKNKDIIEDFLSDISPHYSIAATNNLGSHLSRRQLIYTVPVGLDKADIILFLLNDPFAQPSLKAQKEMAKKMESDKNYVQVFKDGDFIVFEKRNLYLKPAPKKDSVNLFPFSITALSHREYLPQQINIEKKVGSNKSFNSYIISYKSDGLKLYALMDVPNRKKPSNGFPVLIINHGYIQPNLYNTISSYKGVTDYFSSQGFLVLKPDYRGNGNSEIIDKALMRFAYPIDVLNLIASVGNIENADKNQIFLWSHSMGGEVTLETLEVASNIPELAQSIKSAVFWAPVTDPAKWFSKQNLPVLPEAKITPYPYSQTFKILGTPEKNPELWQALSPLQYLGNINVPVLIQHGTGDETVPYTWSVELYNDFLSLNKNAQLLLYTDDNHNLSGSFTKAASQDLRFYKNFLLN